tara:strand:+ start:302 stop:820 length:519 start_codon:yes stop_codon:yes gene_type:complete
MPNTNTTLRSINGANAIIKVGNKSLGYAMGVQVQEVIALNRINVLGQVETQDIEPLGRFVSGSISMMRMVRGGDGDGDYVPGGGAASNELLPAHSTSANGKTRTKDLDDFMQTGFDLVIQDAYENENQEATVRYTIKGCRVSSHTFTLTRGMLMGVNVTFEAIRMIENDATA